MDYELMSHTERVNRTGLNATVHKVTSFLRVWRGRIRIKKKKNKKKNNLEDTTFSLITEYMLQKKKSL